MTVYKDEIYYIVTWSWVSGLWFASVVTNLFDGELFMTLISVVVLGFIVWKIRYEVEALEER